MPVLPQLLRTSPEIPINRTSPGPGLPSASYANPNPCLSSLSVKSFCQYKLTVRFLLSFLSSQRGGADCSSFLPPSLLLSATGTLRPLSGSFCPETPVASQTALLLSSREVLLSTPFLILGMMSSINNSPLHHWEGL